MKHTITFLPDLKSKVKIGYRRVVTETLDKSEIDTLQPFARVY